MKKFKIRIDTGAFKHLSSSEMALIYSADTMRFAKCFIALLLIVLCNVHSAAQQTGRVDFYDSAKYYDFSKIWHGDSVLNLEYVDDTFGTDLKRFRFPEPFNMPSNWRGFGAEPL